MKGRILMGISLLVAILTTDVQNQRKKTAHRINKTRVKFSFKPDTKKFDSPLNLAADKFPELNGTVIKIRQKRIGTLMAARPSVWFLFQKKKNRQYVIYITDHPGMNPKSIYSYMTLQAQTGVFGHELSHILSYTKKNNLELIWFGIKYMFAKKRIEAETDKIALARGFGIELIEYTKYIHRSPHINQRYLRKKIKFYLSPNELEEFMPEIL